MKLRNIGSNQTELTLANGYVVLFSYETPVAACRPMGGFIRTSEYYSRTTSKHINQWLNGAVAEDVEQGVLDNICGAS